MDQLCSISNEAAVLLDSGLTPKIEVDPAVDQPIVNMAVHCHCKTIAVSQSLQLAKIIAKSIGRTALSSQPGH